MFTFNYINNSIHHNLINKDMKPVKIQIAEDKLAIFAEQLTNNILSQDQQIKIKGGDDGIIIEDLVM